MRNFIFFRPPTNIDIAIREIKSHPPDYWEKGGARMVLNLFRWVASTTPAYRAFLKKHKINPAKIKNLKDFKTLPLVSKDNYLRPAVYYDLFPNQDIVSAATISATSGSTGEPFYFPRKAVHDDKYQYQSEIFLKEQFEIDKKKTLGVLGFGLGIWIGGIFTYKVMERISAKGYSFSIVPAGTNKEQFLKAIKKFGHFYDQIILMGYPPFIKDVLDEGKDYGINWRDYEIKILTAAEGFSERFREYLAKKAGLKNMLSDIINIYGTVELGTMAHETALSNLIRHLATKNKKLFKTLFPEATNIPTLAQYYPHLVYFEEVEIDGKKEVVGTGYGTHIPLIRYRFKDLGGVIPYEVMIEKLSACGIDIKKEMKRYKIKASIFPLPFIYVYARSDFSVSLYGIVLYPEYLRDIISDKFLENNITGRFVMTVGYDREYNQFLEINVELQKGVLENRKLYRAVQQSALELLLKYSTEYNHLYYSSSTYQRRLLPKIVFWPYNHPLYFARTGKQPWVKKTKKYEGKL
jgi:phenylacetate-CoA ligase